MVLYSEIFLPGLALTATLSISAFLEGRITSGGSCPYMKRGDINTKRKCYVTAEAKIGMHHLRCLIH
jgi:hypothetical protein